MFVSSYYDIYIYYPRVARERFAFDTYFRYKQQILFIVSYSCMAAMDLGIIFKQKYVDFVVEEKLPYTLRSKPNTNDNRVYIQIQKRNINTMDVLHAIMKAS